MAKNSLADSGVEEEDRREKTAAKPFIVLKRL